MSHLICFLGYHLKFAVLASLATSYVEAIRSGVVPCIENAVVTMATIENAKAVEAALDLYKNLMSERVAMPTPNEETLTAAHNVTLKETVQHFLSKAVFDSDHAYQEELNVRKC